MTTTDTTTAPAAQLLKNRPLLVALGGLLMVVGPLLPWEQGPGAMGVVSIKGTSEGGGPIVLVAGLISAALGWLVHSGSVAARKAALTTLAVSALGLVLVFANGSGISHDVDQAKAAGVNAAVGMGLVLSGFACAWTALTSINLLRKGR